MTTLTVSLDGISFYDRPPNNALIDNQDITSIVFAGNSFQRIIVDADQLGVPHISNTLHVSGRLGGDDSISIFEPAHAAQYSLAGWTFQDVDVIVHALSDFTDFVIGSSIRDFARVGADDQFFLGDGDDVFSANGLGITINPAGAVLDGGGGVDALEISGKIDFRNAALTGIEVAKIDRASSAFFSGHHFGLGGINIVEAWAGEAATLFVYGPFVSLADVEFVGPVSVSIVNDTDVEGILVGSKLDDLILGGAGNDYIDGGESNDTLLGGGGIDRFYGGAGDDLIVSSVQPESSDGISVVVADAGNDTVHALGRTYVEGGAGNDVMFAAGAQSVFLYGEDDDDLLFGSSVNDIFDGGDGVDGLSGGGGSDVFIGGAGIDHFVMGSDIQAGDIEIITDFVGDFIAMPTAYVGDVNVVDTANGVFAYVLLGENYWGFVVTNTHDVATVQASIYYAG